MIDTLHSLAFFSSSFFFSFLSFFILFYFFTPPSYEVLTRIYLGVCKAYYI